MSDMELIKRLPIKDLETMAEYISYFADADCSVNSEKMQNVLHFWEQNKQDLYTIFGKEFILTREVSFQQSADEISAEMTRLLFRRGSKGRTFYESFENWASYRFTGSGYIWDLISSETLRLNTYSGPTFSISLPNDKFLEVKSGCKASRVLGKIAAAFQLDGYEDFRIAHSQCLNQKLTKGELCLSIHPMDYITMSDNDCNWESCMSWMNEGDYRLGTVEMMNSPCVVVAYLKSSSDMNWGTDYKWNNKKWRQLYIVDPSIIMSIRQYPYDNDDLNLICLKWLKELVEKNSDWGPYLSSISMAQNNTATMVNGFTVYFSFTTGYMYNDIYSKHTAFLSSKLQVDSSIDIHFSGPAQCMKCGDVIDDRAPSNTVVCVDCGRYHRCDMCRDRIGPDENYYEVDGSILCCACNDEYTASCGCCGALGLSENMYVVHLIHNGKIIDGFETVVCDHCFYTVIKKNQIGTFYDGWQERNGCRYGCFYNAIDIETLTADGYEMFDITDEIISELIQASQEEE